MKKILLSMFCSLMIGVSCFAPLTVSAAENKSISSGRLNKVDYEINKFINETLQEDKFGLSFNSTNLLDNNVFDKIDSFKIQITLPRELTLNYYYDLYFEIEYENIDVSNIQSVNLRRISNTWGTATNNFVQFVSHSITDNKFIVTVDNGFIYYPTYGFDFSVTGIKKIDESKPATIYIKRLDLFEASSLSELEELQKNPMEDFLKDTGNIFNECMNWIDSLIEIIVTTPILLLTTGFLCLGAAVGLFVRFIYKD